MRRYVKKQEFVNCRTDLVVKLKRWTCDENAGEKDCHKTYMKPMTRKRTPREKTKIERLLGL